MFMRNGYKKYKTISIKNLNYKIKSIPIENYFN